MREVCAGKEETVGGKVGAGRERAGKGGAWETGNLACSMGGVWANGHRIVGKGPMA